MEVFHEGDLVEGRRWGAIRRQANTYDQSDGQYERNAKQICEWLGLDRRPERDCGLETCGAAIKSAPPRPDNFFWLEGVACYGLEHSIADCYAVARTKTKVVDFTFVQQRRHALRCARAGSTDNRFVSDDAQSGDERNLQPGDRHVSRPLPRASAPS